MMRPNGINFESLPDPLLLQGAATQKGQSTKADARCSDRMHQLCLRRWQVWRACLVSLDADSFSASKFCTTAKFV